MIGPVDFNRNAEYWQQDKWIGCFPVKWYIVKDVPNSLLKYIALENNENKPVTNSRDTQEVKLEQGHQLLKIFKGHDSKQSILDDFEFYEDRQRRIQDRKAKHQQLQKPAQGEGKPTEDNSKENDDSKSGDLKSPNSLEVASDMKKTTEAVTHNGDRELSENGYPPKARELRWSVKPMAVPEKRSVANVVSNCC